MCVMEAGRRLISSPSRFPRRTHIRNFAFFSSSPTSSSSSSVLMLHEQVSPVVAPLSVSPLGSHFTSSTEIQEQYDKSQPFLQQKKDITSQAMLDRRVARPHSGDEDNSILRQEKKFTCVDANNVVALAKNALSATEQAASISQSNKLLGFDLDDSLSHQGLVDASMQDKITIRSTRHNERKAKRRRRPKSYLEGKENNHLEGSEVHKPISEVLEPNYRLLAFDSADTHTPALLTAKEESELIVQIKELMKLEEVKSRLEARLSREPTMSEWARAVGVSFQTLKSRLKCFRRSREKFIGANFSLVVHFAKHYQCDTLSVLDLLPIGTQGLIKSIAKVKHTFNRFSAYAYYWIRHAIYLHKLQHFLLIRYPVSVWSQLSGIRKARQLCIENGNLNPSKEEIAAMVGLPVKRIDTLLYYWRCIKTITSRHNRVFEPSFVMGTIADTTFDDPMVIASKEMMTRRLHDHLRELTPREEMIIRMRYAIGYNESMSLNEIGTGFGLTRERVRQIESNALSKLRKRVEADGGIDAYRDLMFS